MPTLPATRIRALLEPFLSEEQASDALIAKLSTYLDLLMRWNGRTNLTAVREPEEIVTRHFGESLFTGSHMASRVSGGATLLDFGSGAGFPGVPIQLLLPELAVTLAESQGKKAAFLRECIRVLDLPTELWSKRVEELPEMRRFDVVTLRAVDKMELAIVEARRRLSEGGTLAILGGEATARGLPSADVTQLPGAAHRYLIMSR